MAIFYSIVEGRVAPTANIFMQVRTYIHWLKIINPESAKSILGEAFHLLEGRKNIFMSVSTI